MKVNFNDTEEFIAELRAEVLGGEVAGRIVRCTHRHTHENPFCRTDLMTSFVNGRGEAVVCRDLIATRFLSEDLKPEQKKESDRLVGLVDRVAKDLGLEVRHGVFEA